MIPAADTVLERTNMPTKQGFVNLYVVELRQYIDAIEADLAQTRARMQREADAGRVPYWFADIIEVQRASAQNADTINYSQVAIGALLHLDRALTSVSREEMNAAIAAYNSLPKYDPRFPATIEEVLRIQLWEEHLPVIRRVADYLGDHDYRVKHLTRGGNQIIVNIAVIFTGQYLLRQR